MSIRKKDIEEIKRDFIKRLDPTNLMRRKRPSLIVIGGAPAVGKTLAAASMAFLAGAYHVQANSARFLLAQGGFPWGDNVRAVTDSVVETLLAAGWSVVLDGTLLEADQRKTLKRTARDLIQARTYFTAILCDPKEAESRARKRYSTNKGSSFEAWRCDESKFEEYIASISTRDKLMKQILSETPRNIDNGVWSIENNRTRFDLEQEIKALWDHIYHTKP